MQPVEETRERLFPWLPVDKLNFFSCNHIVPRESILPIAVSRGPTGRFFDFCYSTKSSSVMVSNPQACLYNSFQMSNIRDYIFLRSMKHFKIRLQHMVSERIFLKIFSSLHFFLACFHLDNFLKQCVFSGSVH